MVLKQRIEFQASVWCVRKIIRDLEFKWEKAENNRQLLIEKDEIRSLRSSYLKAIKIFRRQGRPIVYVDGLIFTARQQRKKLGWMEPRLPSKHRCLKGNV